MSTIKTVIEKIDATLRLATKLAQLGEQLGELVKNVRGLSERLIRVEERLALHDLATLRKENQELRERMIRLETTIELIRADGSVIRLVPPQPEPPQKSLGAPQP